MSVVKTSLRNFLAHKGRMILSGAAVALSVAFVCGTLVFTATMQTTFDKLFAESASDVMIQPGEDGSAMDESPSTGRFDAMPPEVIGEIEAVDGVETAVGIVQSTSIVAVGPDNESVGPTGGAPTMGVNWTHVELRTMEEPEGALPEGPDEIMIDGDTADSSGLGIGDTIRIMGVNGTTEHTVTGVVEFATTNPGAAVVYFDTETAQQVLLGGEGFTGVYVDGDGSVSDEVLRDRVADAIDTSGVRVLTNAEYTQENQDALGAFFNVIQYVLLGFALIALLVGIFLIVNTFTMLVAQRTREIGLFRAIGASRRQVNRSVLLEALILGVVGSVLGFVLGVGLAVGLMAVMGAFGLNLSTDDLTISTAVPITGIVLGITVTLVAAYFPARRAGKITPMAALQDAGLPGDKRAGRIRATIGAVLTVAGALMLFLTTTAERTVAAGGYLGLGILLTLVGMVVFAPALVGGIVKALAVVLLRIFGPIGRLAERNALRNPNRTGGTASALMIGLALVTSLAVVGSSMIASATEEIDRSIGADFIVQTSNFQPVLPDAAEAVRNADHLAAVSEMRGVSAEVTADGDSFEQSFSAVDDSFPDMIRVEMAEGSFADALAPGAVAIGSARADTENLAVGDEITVTFEGGEETTLTIGGITAPGSNPEAMPAYVSMETVRDSVPESELPLAWMLMAIADEGQVDAARESLDSALEPMPQMEVRDQAEYKEMIEQQIGQLLNMVYGLLALAIIVAILGVVNTLALSVVERTREIGLMRAIGLSRRQLRRMIRLEAVVIALFGALLGVAMGLAWGAGAQQILALEGMEVLALPWFTIAVVFVGAALVGLLAALVPAFRAGRMNILDAVSTE
ncbi:ABC transporter permease [Streptomyces bohaiensis]|uniref:FtsX-like permease family protein n=1 Tax=Streptomyces bohaiensis TaxID=1431344 RepID=A0ABX1CCQ4_9ACTN|nr:FtsX-like permease family protein [Streptomyces bohaiensis]NJQ16061.1 FtsX-like permease family protein [Streptomyces bohaiensis]